MAALGTTGTQHRATAASAGANEEAMGALAAHDGRLISTFHVGSPYRKARDYNLLAAFMSSFFSFLGQKNTDRLVDNFSLFG